MRWSFLAWATAVVYGLTPVAADAGQQWLPVSQAELTLARPLVEATADAEVLLWDVMITDTATGVPSTIVENYIRIKVYNERGRDAASTVDLRFSDRQSVREIRGRTTAPNGTVTELNAADVRQRTILEASGVRIRAQSFVLPAVVPGAIIEYRWRDVREGQMAHHLVLPFQRELPVNLVRYRIKPLPVPGYRMRTHVFNATSQPEVSNDKAGYTLIQVRRLPAVRAEPFMPHEMTVGAWMFLHYADSDWDLPEPQFWAKWAKEQSEATSRQLRLNGDLTKAAQEAVAGAATPADKVYALVRFVRQRVRRDTRSDGSNESARDTLRRGTGSGDDAVVLFTALARAAGLEAHLARMPDREIFVAAPRLKQPYFLTRLTTAIKIGTGWTFVDAANEQAPGGQLRWQQEGVYALVLDGAATFLAAGISSRDTSQVRRTGTLRLMANGDLEGDLAVVYSGHLGTRHREQADDQTLAEQERQFTQRLTTYLPRASVTSFRIENLDDPDKAYVVRFSLTVPGFAQSTGTRLRVTTAVLPRELTPAFAATTRTRPVIFPFAWSEVDAFTIQLPDGYEVESMNTPPPVAMPEDAGRLDVAIALSGQSLTYNRSFGFGRSTVAYPVEGYPALKKFFDEARKADGAGVLLRRKGDGNAR